MKNLSRAAAVGVALLLFVTGCTDPAPDGPTVVSSVAPVIEAVDCPADAATPPSDWPIALPSSLVVTDYGVIGNEFTATGVSNNGELLLNSTLEESFANYESSEPDGGANDLIVTFESANATGSLFMTDENGDGCWDVELTVLSIGEPEAGEFVPTDPAGSDGESATATDTEVGGGVDVSTGTAAATTAQGTFQLSVASCQLSPVAVEAVAPEGQLVVQESADGQVALTWTHADGTVVSDQDSKAVISSSTTALIVGDGQGTEGPETVIVDITCGQG